jgi:hypothetical protein
VAQFGSALDWGSRGRRFKSCRPDQKIHRTRLSSGSIFFVLGKTGLTGKPASLSSVKPIINMLLLERFGNIPLTEQIVVQIKMKSL